MRDFRIDYTNKENPFLDGSVAGNQGEHNATKLIITPPEEMTNYADISFYKIAFELTNNRVIHSDPINKVSTFEMLLPQQVTSSRTIGIQLEGYGADSELIAKSSKLSKILFRKSVCGTEIDYKGEPFGISAEVSANTLARHTHGNADVLNEFGENESGKPTYRGKTLGGSVERPTETKEFLNAYLYEPNADVSFFDGKALLICAGYDEQNDLSNKEIAKIEMNLDFENWIDVKDIIQIYPQFPYAINMNRSFLCTEKQNKTAVCFGVLGFFETGGNSLVTDIEFHNQCGFRVTYYTD